MSCRVCCAGDPGWCYCEPCCVCGKSVDTYEVKDGGSEEGCQLDNGKWVCSFDCWEAATLAFPQQIR